MPPGASGARARAARASGARARTAGVSSTPPIDHRQTNRHDAGKQDPERQDPAAKDPGTKVLFDFPTSASEDGPKGRRQPRSAPSPRRAGTDLMTPASPATTTHGDATGDLDEPFDPSALFTSDVFGARSMIAARVPARLPHVPAFEGLRGVAIIAVLLFFGDAPFLGGGFLAISTFLTLMGFLVTRNLLGRMLDGRALTIDDSIKARLRRLMPLIVAGVSIGVAYTVTFGDVGQVNRLFGDVVTSLTFTGNWRSVALSQSYLSLLQSPSAMQQYWSLAVAEQVNLVLLAIALGSTVVATWSRRRSSPADPRDAVRAFTIAIGVLLAASVACSLALGFSHSRVYFGTDTRSAELLVGAFLAVMVVHRPNLGSSRFAPTIAVAGLIAGIAILVLWAVTPISSPWVYGGGLTAYSLVSLTMIGACLIPRSPIAAALSVRPLREVGKVAFGLYVLSWPVFLILSPQRLHISGVPLFAVRIAVTASLAFAAHRFIDAPVREGRNLYGFKPSAAIGGTIAVIMLATMATASNAPAPATDLSQPFTAAGVPIGDGRLTIPSFAVFGDSTAIPIQRGLTKWVESTNRAVSRQGRFAVGCGVVPGGAWQLGATTGEMPDRCEQLQTEWADALEPGAPTMAIVTPGLLEVANRRVPGDDRWRAIGVPEVELYYMKQMIAVTDTLSSKGAKVVWLTMPPVLAGTQYDARPNLGQAVDPARARRLNELIGELPQFRPDKVAVIDLAGWLESNDPEGSRFRPDGVHLSDDGATHVARDFLSPELLRLAGVDPDSNASLVPNPGAGGTTVLTGTPECTTIRTFGLSELAAAASRGQGRAERERSFSGLVAAGNEAQQVAPDLREAVEAREAYWSEALGLASGDDQAPAEPPPETEESQRATSQIDEFKETRCH